MPLAPIVALVVAAVIAWGLGIYGPGAERETIRRVETLLTRDAPRLDDGERAVVARTIVEAGSEHDIDPLLLLAVIETESTYDPAARSWAGGTGLMQLRLPTARAVARRQGLGEVDRARLHEPELNIRLGAAYLAELRQQFQDWPVVLAAYHSGPTRIRRLRRAGRPVPTAYARKVLSRHDALRDGASAP